MMTADLIDVDECPCGQALSRAWMRKHGKTCPACAKLSEAAEEAVRNIGGQMLLDTRGPVDWLRAVRAARAGIERVLGGAADFYYNEKGKGI